MVSTYFQDDELQLRNVILMYPVLGGLTNKILLAASSGAVTLGRVASCPYVVVKL